MSRELYVRSRGSYKTSLTAILAPSMLIELSDDEAMLRDSQGIIIEYEQIIDICDKLKKFAYNNKDEIKEHNEKRKLEIEKSFKKIGAVKNEFN